MSKAGYSASVWQAEHPVTDNQQQRLQHERWALICAIALALSLLGLDWMTALTGAASTVSGVGPGLGETIGPAGNFSTLPDAAKWILSLGMLLGRLEIITVFVLCIPAFWRH
mgnify:CR=1 FL=1